VGAGLAGAGGASSNKLVQQLALSRGAARKFAALEARPAPRASFGQHLAPQQCLSLSAGALGEGPRTRACLSSPAIDFSARLGRVPCGSRY